MLSLNGSRVSADASDARLFCGCIAGFGLGWVEGGIFSTSHLLSLPVGRRLFLSFPFSFFGFLPSVCLFHLLSLSQVPVVDVQAICRETPALQELHLCDNGIVRLDPSGALRLIAPNFVTQPLRLPKSLTVLDLEGNELEGWDSLCAVGHLPALKTIVVRGNRLKRVTAAREGTFLALETIDLSNNEVATGVSTPSPHPPPLRLPLADSTRCSGSCSGSRAPPLRTQPTAVRGVPN